MLDDAGCPESDTAEPIAIVADDRERDGGVVGLLRHRDDVCLTIERLPLGDYRIDDALLVERKTLPDLILSIKDARLFSQGLRLAEADLRTALILEGTSRDIADSGMRREAIQGALITLTLFLRIPLLRSMDQAETARLLLYAAHQARSIATGALTRRGRRPRGKFRTQAHILQGLPGIGPERAKRLLDHFGSVEAVILAHVPALTEVPGIGSTTAEAIRWSVEESVETYFKDDDMPV